MIIEKKIVTLIVVFILTQTNISLIRYHNIIFFHSMLCMRLYQHMNTRQPLKLTTYNGLTYIQIMYTPVQAPYST